MKHKPFENNGKWYVKIGKKYYPNTEKKTKEEVAEVCKELEEQYLTKLVGDYRFKSEKTFAKLVKMFPEKYTDGFDGVDSKKCNWGDLCC